MDGQCGIQILLNLWFSNRINTTHDMVYFLVTIYTLSFSSIRLFPFSLFPVEREDMVVEKREKRKNIERVEREGGGKIFVNMEN